MHYPLLYVELLGQLLQPPVSVGIKGAVHEHVALIGQLAIHYILFPTETSAAYEDGQLLTQ